jgi:integrase
MNELLKVKEYEYYGVLAPFCKALVDEKRAVGYKYKTEAELLSRFSYFTKSFDISPMTLPREVVKAWIAPRPMESDRTRYARFSIVKILADYMARTGYQAYIPMPCEARKMHKTFVPYIFTNDEIRLLFDAVDSMKVNYRTSAPRRHLVLPVLFRILYCCGLRVTEVTQLLGEDVNLNNGILTIRKTKFSKNRYVPMSKELTDFCADYAQTRLIGEPVDWFLPARDGGYYCDRSVYTAFRELLYRAGIPHGGRGKGPRVHDLRHTFAVHCLQQWVKRGEDITTALPYLREYLGHINLRATEQYLRMTAEVYPEISALVQEKYGYIFPRMEALDE